MKKVLLFLTALIFAITLQAQENGTQVKVSVNGKILPEPNRDELMIYSQNKKWRLGDVQHWWGTLSQDTKDSILSAVIAPGGDDDYLEYTAILFQSGTDNPSANVLKNTLGATLTWSRVDVGKYECDLPSTASFLNESSVVFVSGGSDFGSGPNGITLARIRSVVSPGPIYHNVVEVHTFNDVSNTLADDKMNFVCITIKVYL